ncbi:hypothetical protein PRIPAC_85187 [Pristionchus pacificus]|uniref:Uncharacterized protein n=1 Tax=Pristionchus pacificus TaxID=54126 RepID=A0A2A6BU99_PRIPA|nr:hypothetical protein PRIPAC_85187 [Pristionchus pacificus]|eukprot:PDM69489.1 hypothetical protein PRIPAC_44585 [Pristionchus pacificus]
MRQLHILSKHDCDPGLYWAYCVKTLTRRSPATDHCLPKSAYNWTTNRLLLVSAVPIMSPCLSVDERSLTIDARLTEDIAMCAERYSRGLVQFMDWSPGHNIPPVPSADSNRPIVHECPLFAPSSSSSEFLLYTAVFSNILMLALTPVKDNQDLCLNAAVPTVPRPRLDSSNEALRRDILS